MEGIVEIDEEVRDARRHAIGQLVNHQDTLELLRNDGVVRLISVSLAVKSHNTYTLRNLRMTRLLQTHYYRRALCRRLGSDCPT